jgi:general secretion pathway protein D
LPNLEPLLPTSATLTVNESANTLILVASKTDIKRVLKIVNALDNSLASTAAIKVLLLHYANAKDMAAIITQLYAQSSNAQSTQVGSFPNFGGGPPGGGFGGFPSGPGQNAAPSSSSGRGSTAGRVNAVADDRANALILSAPPDLLGAIQAMVDKLDQPVDDLTELRVFHLVNAEPSELAGQLATLFPDDTSSNTSQAGNMPFYFPPGGGPSANSSTAGTGSERMKKIGRVLAVPDPRTSSLIVTAGKSLMPQIAQMIARLDADEGKREIVGYFELQHADPQDVSQNMQDLFNRTLRINNNNQTTLLGPNHPLTQRQTQNQQGSTSSSSTMSGGMGGLQSGTGSRSGF